jgi:hypothetical protein
MKLLLNILAACQGVKSVSGGVLDGPLMLVGVGRCISVCGVWGSVPCARGNMV